MLEYRKILQILQIICLKKKKKKKEAALHLQGCGHVVASGVDYELFPGSATTPPPRIIVEADGMVFSNGTLCSSLHSEKISVLSIKLERSSRDAEG